MRRRSSFALLFPLVVLVTLTLLAEDFWKTKPPEDWSQEELLQLLNDSPWTRKINLWQITGRRFAVFPDGSTALYQESPSSPVIQYSRELDRVEIERQHAVYAVRWSSASVVIETLAKLEKNSSVLAALQAPPPKIMPDYYILTVRVVQPPTLSGADKMSRATIYDQTGSRPLPTTETETKIGDILGSLTEEELLKASELRTNRKLRLKPDKVLRHGKGAGEGVSFFFPRQTNGQPLLSPKTKWLEFRFKGKLGNQLKARFKLNEMQLAGQPDY